MILEDWIHADADTYVQPFFVSCYLRTSLIWQNLCSYTNMVSLFYSVADAVCLDSWFIVFNVLTLNVAMFTMVVSK